MRWVVIFTDQAEMVEHRNINRGKHVAYISEYPDEILIGGALKPTPDGDYVGGMWILEVDSRDRAQELVENDPYYNPTYRAYEIYSWGKILHDKMVTL